MRLKGFLAFGLVAAMGVFLVSGCCCPATLTDQIGSQIGSEVKKGVEKGIEDSTGATINTDKTDATGEDLKSVPRYPGSTRTQYIKVPPTNGTIGITLMYETSDDPAKVIAWYKDKMAGLGWTVSSSGSVAESTETTTYSKNENATTANVTVGKPAAKTIISISYYGPEEGA
jgi:hypothetical protein